MSGTEKTRIQCAIVQLQARSIDNLYSLLYQHKTVEGKEVEIQADQEDAMETQKDIIDNLFRELSKYLSPAELDGLLCIKEINEAAGLRNYLERNMKP